MISHDKTLLGLGFDLIMAGPSELVPYLHALMPFDESGFLTQFDVIADDVGRGIGTNREFVGNLGGWFRLLGKPSKNRNDEFTATFHGLIVAKLVR